MTFSHFQRAACRETLLKPHILTAVWIKWFKILLRSEAWRWLCHLTDPQGFTCSPWYITGKPARGHVMQNHFWPLEIKASAKNTVIHSAGESTWRRVMFEGRQYFQCCIAHVMNVKGKLRINIMLGHLLSRWRKLSKYHDIPHGLPISERSAKTRLLLILRVIPLYLALSRPHLDMAFSLGPQAQETSW